MSSVVNHRDRLKRFLYTGNSELPKYIAGHDLEGHKYYEPEKLEVIVEILHSDNPEIFFNILEITNGENVLPRRETIFVALAHAAINSTNLNATLRSKIYATLINLCRNDEDLFLFIKFCMKRKKSFSSSLNKYLKQYYNRKDPMDLAKDVASFNGYHGWKHKDVLKLCHCESQSVLTTVVYTYVLFGLKKAKLVAENNPDAGDIIKYLTKIEELKRCEDEDMIVTLIHEVGATYWQVPSFFRRSKKIWDALLPTISINDLVDCLPRLYKLGFLKANTPFLSKVVETLTNLSKIKESRICPSEVFIGLRNFEKGGKPIDPKLANHLESKPLQKIPPPEGGGEAGEGCSTAAATSSKKNPYALRMQEPPKCNVVFNALNKLLQLSYGNLEPTGKRYMITIDLTEKMSNSCFKSRNLSCLEAAAILTLSILNTERDVAVAVFNDNKVFPVHLEKNASVSKAIIKLKHAKSGYVMASSPFEWAMSKKKHVDVFINMIYHHHWFRLIPKELRDRDRPLETLKQYRKKMQLTHTKLITFSFYSPHLSVANGMENVLDVCGFDKDVPKVVEAFCRGSFC